LATQPEIVPELALTGLLQGRPWVSNFLRYRASSLQDPEDVARLVKARLLAPAVIPSEIKTFWSFSLSADQALEHVALSIMRGSEFQPGLRQQWIRQASRSKLRALLQAGLLTPEEVPEDRRPKKYFASFTSRDDASYSQATDLHQRRESAMEKKESQAARA
jgi:hypothetical protein